MKSLARTAGITVSGRWRGRIKSVVAVMKRHLLSRTFLGKGSEKESGGRLTVGYGIASVEEKDYRREIVPIVSTISSCISGSF